MFRVYADDDEEILFAHMNNKPHRDNEVVLGEYLEKGWEIEPNEEEESVGEG